MTLTASSKRIEVAVIALVPLKILLFSLPWIGLT